MNFLCISNLLNWNVYLTEKKHSICNDDHVGPKLYSNFSHGLFLDIAASINKPIYAQIPLLACINVYAIYTAKNPNIFVTFFLYFYLIVKVDIRVESFELSFSGRCFFLNFIKQFELQTKTEEILITVSVFFTASNVGWIGLAIQEL